MKEKGLKLLRFLLLISSTSPVFALLAIKGSDFNMKNYDSIYSVIMWTIVILSFLPLLIRYNIAKDEKIKLTINTNITACVEEYSTYILSIALPLCQNDLISTKQLPFFIAIIIFILVVFYIFNLYYLNIFFYILGYKLYKVTPDNTHSYVIISKKEIQELRGKDILTIRLTDSLFFEKELN
ncbi:MAG: hypothetical protein MR368_00030 [Azospirillum sp.]|nr:hypothetical protein [Azospirillum sp.]